MSCVYVSLVEGKLRCSFLYELLEFNFDYYVISTEYLLILICNVTNIRWKPDGPFLVGYPFLSTRLKLETLWGPSLLPFGPMT